MFAIASFVVPIFLLSLNRPFEFLPNPVFPNQDSIPEDYSVAEIPSSAPPEKTLNFSI